MKKIIVHIGYPKTATKSMQLNIFTPLMRKGRIEYLNHLEQGHPNHGNFSVRNIISYIVGQNPHADYHAETKKLPQIKKTTVLSCETISHVSEKWPTASYKIGAIENAKKVAEIFSPYFDTVEIVMTVREQCSMISSYFTQEFFNIVNRNPVFEDFGLWLEENFKQQTNKQGLFLDYHAMFKAYANYFGKENVHVLVYEDLLHDKNSFYQKLSQIFNVKTAEIKSLFESSIQNKTKKVNKDFVETDRGDLHAKLLTFAHKVFKNKDSKLFATTKKIFKALIPKELLNAKVGTGVKIRKLTDDERKLIKDLFSQSNEQLITDAMLDKDKMIRYGYISNNR